MDNKYIAIVDAYSAANQYAPEFNRRGYKCIHIQSAREIPAGYVNSFKIDDFVANIIHDGILSDTISKFKDYKIEHLIAGTETGVELADKLSEEMGFATTNGSRMSEAKRNKFVMHEALKAAGLRSISHFKSDNVREIINWVNNNAFETVVIKPLNSAGTDTVAFCRNENDIKEAFNKIIGRKNEMGFINEEVLAQEFIQGTEHVVDTVSCRGELFFMTIWRYKKKLYEDLTYIYDRDDLLDGKDRYEKELTDYMKRVLDVMEIKFGPVHAEVMYDKNGPVLMELGARVDGMEDLKFFREIVGHSQIDLTLDAYLNPDEMLLKQPRKLTPLKNAVIVSIISNQSGIVRSTNKLDIIRKLPSFCNMKTKVKEGSKVEITKDIFTMPGIIYLVHKDKQIIEEDYNKIRALEEDGIFELYS